jgi:hypothetical protein
MERKEAKVKMFYGNITLLHFSSFLPFFLHVWNEKKAIVSQMFVSDI